MNNAASSISGVRVSAATRRETRRVAKRLPMNISVHLVLITLSLLVWWIARDMVSVTQKLENASRLKFELAEELKGEWKVLGEESVLVSIEARGPTKKLNEFASELAANPGRYGYVFRVTRADIPTDVGSRRQVVLNVDLEQLRPTAEGGEPAELIIRPITGDRNYQVTLECYVTKAAYVDLDAGITGKVPGYRYTASIPTDTLLQVRGPASKVEGLGGTADRAKLAIRLDVADFINNRTATQRKTVADLLAQESRLTTTASIIPREEIVVQQVSRPERPTDPAAIEIVNQVAIELLFTREQLYETLQRSFPVSVREPRWLKEKGGKVTGYALDLVVKLDVLASQRELFNENNVSVMIDLLDLKESDLALDPPQPGKVGGKPRQELNYRLWISRELNIRLQDGVTLEQYFPVVGLTLEWPS